MIKLVFISNILDQSMIGFCDAISKQKEIDFKFVTYKSKMSNIKTRSNLVRTYRYDYSQEIENEVIKNADAIIVGHAPDYFVKKYRKEKLVFKSSERLFKEKTTVIGKVKRVLSIIKHHAIFQCKNLYYLGISDGAIDDIKKTKLYKNRIYKWVYFPEIDQSYDLAKIQNKDRNLNKTIKIVWAGRMVECKNIHTIIESVKLAIDNGYDINLQLIGDGPLKSNLEKQSENYPQIKFFGLKPLNETLNLIKEADFLFMASDKREGWGMVVNNAINYGTNVIGNNMCGSISTLLNSNNAFLYSEEKDAYNTLIKAITTTDKIRENMAVSAFSDLIRIWAPEIGAERFTLLLKSLIEDKKEITFNDGLFSH